MYDDYDSLKEERNKVKSEIRKAVIGEFKRLANGGPKTLYTREDFINDAYTIPAHEIIFVSLLKKHQRGPLYELGKWLTQMRFARNYEVEADRKKAEILTNTEFEDKRSVKVVSKELRKIQNRSIKCSQSMETKLARYKNAYDFYLFAYDDVLDAFKEKFKKEIDQISIPEKGDTEANRDLSNRMNNIERKTIQFSGLHWEFNDAFVDFCRENDLYNVMKNKKVKELKRAH